MSSSSSSDSDSEPASFDDEDAKEAMEGVVEQGTPSADVTMPFRGGKKWVNRQRVLVFCSRGCTSLQRHLMTDLRSLMPHSKTDAKLDTKHHLPVINEIAEMKNCSKCLFFEARKGKDLYLWAANTHRGPSIKFLVHNVHTMAELKLSGNCLKGSRPIVAFDDAFDQQPHLQLAKELFTQTFGTPNHHPKSQPFIDHIFNFSVTPDKKIWFRNYQIVDEETQRLEEIGPRMVLELIKVFEGSFGGAVLYENNDYVAPNLLRRQLKLAQSTKYKEKVDKHQDQKERREKQGPSVKVDVFDSVFDTQQRSAPDEKSTDDALEALKNDLSKPIHDRRNKNKNKRKRMAD